MTERQFKRICVFRCRIHSFQLEFVPFKSSFAWHNNFFLENLRQLKAINRNGGKSTCHCRCRGRIVEELWRPPPPVRVSRVSEPMRREWGGAGCSSPLSSRAAEPKQQRRPRAAATNASVQSQAIIDLTISDNHPIYPIHFYIFSTPPLLYR